MIGQKMSLKYWKIAIPVASLFSVFSTMATAQEDMRAAAQNPLSSMYSLPLKFSYDQGAKNGNAGIFTVQPVIPITIGNWNLVNRVIIPYADIPGPISGQPGNPNPIPGPGARGLGDINYSIFFSPVKTSKIIWGLGPSINFPTATNDQLGSGKWSIGPTAVALTITDWGSMGGIARHLWSVAGDSNRKYVNQSLIEPFVNYNLDNGWFVMSDLVITANWSAPHNNRWTVPLGGGVGRVFNIGKQAINAKMELYHNIVRPDGAPDWKATFTWQFMFPKS
jgi:hypothetical protein